MIAGLLAICTAITVYLIRRHARRITDTKFQRALWQATKRQCAREYPQHAPRTQLWRLQ